MPDTLPWADGDDHITAFTGRKPTSGRVKLPGGVAWRPSRLREVVGEGAAAGPVAKRDFRVRPMAALIPRSIEWVDTVPIRVVAPAESSAPPAAVFAVLADHERWPEWFPGLRKGTVMGAPTGVGVRRRGPLRGASLRPSLVRAVNQFDGFVTFVLADPTNGGTVPVLGPRNTCRSGHCGVSAESGSVQWRSSLRDVVDVAASLPDDDALLNFRLRPLPQGDFWSTVRQTGSEMPVRLAHPVRPMGTQL